MRGDANSSRAVSARTVATRAAPAALPVPPVVWPNTLLGESPHLGWTAAVAPCRFVASTEPNRGVRAGAKQTTPLRVAVLA